MSLDPRRARRMRDCKLKRVHPRLPLHVHSAGQERVARTSPSNPTSAEAGQGRSAGGAEWSADRLCNRLEGELTSDAWRRPESAARRAGTTVESLFRRALAEAS